MSSAASAHVWAHSQQHGSALLVLLAIADRADDQGQCPPSVAALAEQSRMSARTVQKYLRVLEAAGELIVHRRQGIRTARGVTNQYEIPGVRGVAVDTPGGEGSGQRGEASGTKTAGSGSARGVAVDTRSGSDDQRDRSKSDDDLIYFQQFQKRFGLLEPETAARLRAQWTRLTAAGCRDVMERCIWKGARTWKYVAVALENEPTPLPAIPTGQGDEAQLPLPLVVPEAAPALTPLPPPPPVAVPPQAPPLTGEITPERAWEIAYSQLELQLDRDNFEMGVRGTIFQRCEEGVFVIEARDEYAQKWLQGRLYRSVQRIVSDAWGKPVEVSIPLRGTIGAAQLAPVSERAG